MSTPIEIVDARLAELAETVERFAATDPAELGDEARAKYDEINTEVDGLLARKADLEKAVERAARLKGLTFNTTVVKDNPFDVDVTRASDADVIGAARKIVDESRYFVRDSHRESVTALLDRGPVRREVAERMIVLGTDEYRSAWAKLMTGRQYALTADESQAVARAALGMSVGSNSGGGYAVPPYLDTTMIVTGSGATNPLRDIATVKQLPQGNTWKGVTAGQLTVNWVAEASTTSIATNPVVGQPSIPVYAAKAQLTATFEVFEDLDNLAEDVAMLFADGKNILEAIAFQTGTGSSQPTGVLTAVSNGSGTIVAATTTGVYQVADVYKLHQNLPPRYRNGPSRQRAWLGNVAVMNATRQFSTNYYNTFWATLGQGLPAQLLGENVYEASQMTATITTGNQILLFGDFSKYLIIDKVGMTVEFIPNLFDGSSNANGQRAWLMHWRVGADCADPTAFRVLKV